MCVVACPHTHTHTHAYAQLQCTDSMYLWNFKKLMVPMVVAAMEAEVPFIVVHLDEFHKLAKLHDNKDKHKTTEYLFSELQSWLENGTYESANAWPKSRGLQDYNPHVIFMISGNVFPPSATVRNEEKDCKAVSKQIGAIMGSGTYGDDGARRPGTSLSLSLSRAFSVCLSVCLVSSFS